MGKIHFHTASASKTELVSLHIGKNRGAKTGMSKRVFDGSDDGNESSKKSRSADTETALHVYQPCVPIPVQGKMNSLVEVLLPAKFLISDAKTIKLRQLWGTDVYSDDSDLVA